MSSDPGSSWPPEPGGPPPHSQAHSQAHGQWVRQGGKSRPLAVFLALVLGGLGIHRFYLGQLAWGALFLVFSWTGIPGILAWFEALSFLRSSDEDWALDHGGSIQRPNRMAMGCLWIVALLPLLFIALAIIAIPVLVLFGSEVSSILSGIGSQVE